MTDSRFPKSEETGAFADTFSEVYVYGEDPLSSTGSRRDLTNRFEGYMLKKTKIAEPRFYRVTETVLRNVEEISANEFWIEYADQAQQNPLDFAEPEEEPPF